MSQLPDSIQQVVRVIQKRAKPKEIVLFGSRARGDHRSNSDFDIAIVGRDCSDIDWTRLLVDLAEEPYTLYGLEVVEFETLSRQYQKNIRAEGKVLYG